MANNPFTRHKVQTLSIALGLMVAVWLLYVYRGNLSRESLMALSERLPAFWIWGAFLILPLCGVPIRIMLVLVGFRFGFVGGWMLAEETLFRSAIKAPFRRGCLFGSC